MDKLEHREVKFETMEIKQLDNGKFNLKAYASVFGNDDSYDDIVDKGAFINTIENDFKRMRLCINHNLWDVLSVIGKINVLREDEKGLFIDADLSQTTNGKDVAILLEDKAIDELSIGYQTISSHTETIGGVEYRHLTELKLYEISIVTRASNDQATILSTQRKSEIEAGAKAMNDVDLTELINTLDSEYLSRVIKILDRV